jgi:hypothetical protein
MSPAVPHQDPRYLPTVQQTLQSLDSAAADTSLASISGLGIPQVRELKHEIAEIFPASNLPGFLLQGLLQMKGRDLDGERVSGDLRVLFRETRQIGLYGTFLAAPALIIYGYQRLLTLAGKDIDSAFPDGTWQFYTEFGLREDAARHSVETRGFAAVAGLAEVDAAACWVSAAIHTIFAYDELLANEWHERVALRCVDLALAQQADAGLGRRPTKPDERAQAIAAKAESMRSAYGLDRLAVDWAVRRPYAGPANSPIFGYGEARRRTFDAFLERRMRAAPDELRARSEALYAERRARDLPAYLAQMSILQTLRAEGYSDRREPLSMADVAVAFVCGGSYHLIAPWERDEASNLLITPRGGDPTKPGQSLPLRRDASGEWSDSYGQPAQIDRRGEVRVAGMRVGRLRPLPLAQVRALLAAAMREARPLRPAAPAPPGADLLLAVAPRGRQEHLRGLLAATARAEVERLRAAPIIVSWDGRDPAQPLGVIRRTRRGCGDQALTIMRAGEGVVFDMSHIFFDGIWGAMLAEVTTGFACALVGEVDAARPARAAAPPSLGLAVSPALERAVREASVQAPAEACAETRLASLPAITTLRRRLAEREMPLTVNDILLLARYDHAASYRPGPVAMAALDDLAGRGGEAARLHNQILEAFEAQRALVPSLLIPMDASWIDPRQRLHPATLRNPHPDLLPRLARTEALLRALAKSPTPAARKAFDAERTELCGDLLAYAAVLRALREITTRGESFTTAALKLLGHLPRPVQSLMDLIPQKIDLLNEIVKGAEVFSNIGQVARSSSVARFASSRDDGDTKLLIWGLMADARGQLVITLRDFRPHVGPLLAAGHGPLAELLAADFLDAYAQGLNGLVKRFQRVLAYK